MIGLGHFLSVAAILFAIGMAGIFVNRKNVIIILMSIELMLLAVNINLVAFSQFLGDLTGQVFAFMVLTVAAAEAVPEAPTTMAAVAMAASSGASIRQTTSYFPKAKNRWCSLPPMPSISFDAAAARSVGLAIIAFTASVE